MRYVSIGIDSDFELIFPNQRVFAFSPNYAEIIGTAVQQDFSFVYGNAGQYKITRYTGADNKLRVPLSGLFQTMFKDTEFGEVAPAESGKYTNLKSKTYESTNILVYQGDTLLYTMVFDLFWGALQPSEIEQTETTIYRFGNLPISITQTNGTSFEVDGSMISESSTLGKEILFSTFGATVINKINLLSGSTIVKSYNIINSDCTDGFYLRWIGLDAEYRYHLLKLGNDDIASKAGATFNKLVWSNDATVGGLIRQKTQLLNKSVGRAITCGESAADDEMTKHLESLLKSVKQWLYVGNNQWLEVTVGDMTISKKRNDGKREISVQIVLPDYYTQSL